jgi:hypothetical protein
VLSGTVQKLGNLNKFAVDILDILDGSFIDGYEERYTSLSQGVEVIPKLASQVSGVKVSSTSAPAAQPAANTRSTSTPSTPSTAQSGNGIMLLSNEWKINKDSSSTVNISVGRENINGQEKEVLTLDIRVAGGDAKWAGVGNWDDTIAQKLRTASGVRFKTLGDGKKWSLIIAMRETSGDGGTHRLDFTTQRGKVADIDIPFSRLRQPEWGKRVTFNKNSVTGMQIERNNNLGSGAATIKIFDIEVY